MLWDAAKRYIVQQKESTKKIRAKKKPITVYDYCFS